MSSILSRATMNPRGTSDYISLVEAVPPGAVLTLDGVTWNEYENLLCRLDERPGVRLAYDHGRLEVMSPSPEHEGIAGLLPHLLMALAEESNLNFLSLKSMTIRKREASRGLEPDDCFYFHKLLKTSGKTRFCDASVDPPPELAIEIDVTSRSLNKFPIFAAFGIRELWRYAGGRMHFYRLTGKEYTEITHSDLFAFLTPATVSRFLRKGAAQGGVPMVKAFRSWILAHKPRGLKGRSLGPRLWP
jgi:Uma2 family endonuclease